MAETPGPREGAPTPLADEPLQITDAMLADSPGLGAVEFEKGISYAPPLTLALIVACIAVFAWELATGALDGPEAIVRAGALDRARILGGESWRLLTALFLHGGPDHLVGNCMALYVVGMACEHAVGARRTAAIYLGAGVCASLSSIAAHAGPAVGASGAVFGVLAATVVILYRHQGRFYVRDKRIAAALAAWAAYTILLGFSEPYVDNFAHIGGLVAGGAAAWHLKPRLLEA